jgi:hypothetical protein
MPKPKPKPKQHLPPKATPKPDPPNWPPLRPLIPAPSLTLDTLVPDQISLIHNFLTSTLCKTYVSFLQSLPLATTPGRPKRGDAVRVNDRFQIEDPRFAEMLWSGTALRELVTATSTEEEEGDGEGRAKTEASNVWGGEPLGLNANIRIYRYSAGQFFARHCMFCFRGVVGMTRGRRDLTARIDDDSNTLTFPSDPPKPARTTWTLLIYLSTCKGGETVFYPEATRENRNPEPVSVAPETGLALLHRHGERCLQHEGMEVVEGEKWVLRSDLVVGR